MKTFYCKTSSDLKMQKEAGKKLCLKLKNRMMVIMPFKYTDEKKFTVCLEGIFIWEENRNILLILS